MSLATLKAESKRIVRRPIAKVRITWTDPLIDISIQPDTTENNRVSYPELAADLIEVTPYKWFYTNDTAVTLDGTWRPAPGTLLEARRTQMGWWGTNTSIAGGVFSSPPQLGISFTSRLVVGFRLVGDTALNEYPVDFTVQVQRLVGAVYITVETKTVTGNNNVYYTGVFNQEHRSAARLLLTVNKWSAAGKIVKIAEFYGAIIEEYEGDEILYMNLLEEFDGSEGTLPVGNISCNEIDLSLQNIDDKFFPANTDSRVHTFIKRNRKIEPFFGFIYPNGTKEYTPKGLYWSGDWSIADKGTGAQTTARDRFELLRKDSFPAAEVYPLPVYNATLKSTLETVLEKLREYLPDLFWDIDPDFGNEVVPVVIKNFFDKKKFFEVVRIVVSAGLGYAYMDTPTDAEIAANGPLMKDILRVKSFDKVFPHENTGTGCEVYTRTDFIDKTQPAKSEELANIVQVTHKEWTFTPDEDPLKEGKWEAVDTTVEARHEDSIRENGRLTFVYADNDLIQSETLAQQIADTLVASYAIDRKDIEVSAFGDPTLNLAEKLEFPEYQKNGIDKRGIFVLSRIATEWDGTLRQTLSGRKVQDDVVVPVYEIYQDTDGADEAWQDTDGATDKYQDAGV
jgi:hypothetical protein